MLPLLLLIFVKLAFEPHVRENGHLNTVLRQAKAYPWHLIEYKGIECVFDWLVLTVEPSIVLNLSSEHDTVDKGILT